VFIISKIFFLISGFVIPLNINQDRYLLINFLGFLGIRIFKNFFNV
jgi:hypothetical protein